MYSVAPIPKHNKGKIKDQKKASKKGVDIVEEGVMKK